ncbi:MAG TPA: nucleoside-diphosphate sugar epimerase/dehydratase [Gemmatimonadaceae bacterium]
MAITRLRHFGYRRPVVIATHIALIALAYLAAFALRFDFRIPHQEWRLFEGTLPYLLVIRFAVLGQMRVFRGSWRHVSLHDLMTLATSVTLSTVLFVAVLFLTGALAGMSRSVLLLDWMLFIFLGGGVRFAARCVREGQRPWRAATGTRTLLIGAGVAAERFLRHSLHSKRGLHFVGLLDDSPRLHRLSLHGVPVLGAIDRVGVLAAEHDVEQLVIAIPSATGVQIRRIVTLCAETGVDFKILPSLEEMLDGSTQAAQPREVQIEDLLGREPVYLELDRVERDLAHRTVLVTGGAGSIGSELARQIAGFSPARLVLLEQAESPLYYVHLELRRAYPGLDVVPVIGDVADPERLEHVFSTYRPDYVFHAAAYKHVPMMEANVTEAVRNNVFGTLWVAEAAARHGAKKFVLISTDKAVNPSSVMGTTKRLAERIVLGWPALCASSTDFRAVRFGNVLGSDGSVVPLFKKQLAAGGPLTVTDPGVTRYFMSIPEAVQLVLQAAALPEAASRIAMLDMGEPIRILDLAEQLIRLSGLVPYRDVEIVFTGLRPGEKLNEELMSLMESGEPTAVEKIRVVSTGGLDGATLQAGITRLHATLAAGMPASLVSELRELVPEYVPQGERGDGEAFIPAIPELECASRRSMADGASKCAARDLGGAASAVDRSLQLGFES